jgi:DcmR-like sensory protein
MSRQWSGPPWRFHEVGFYRSDAEFGALIVPFVEAGVAAGQPVILGYDDRKASLLRSWLADPAAVTFIADDSLYVTPARAIDSYWRMFADLTAAGATQIRIAGDVPHEGNGGRFAGWDRYQSAANTVWRTSPAPVARTTTSAS